MLLAQSGLAGSDRVNTASERRDRGETVIFIILYGSIAGLVSVVGRIRQGATQALTALHKLIWVWPWEQVPKSQLRVLALRSSRKIRTVSSRCDAYQGATLKSGHHALHTSKPVLCSCLQCLWCTDRCGCAIPVFWYSYWTRICRLCNECLIIVCSIERTTVADGEHLTICRQSTLLTKPH